MRVYYVKYSKNRSLYFLFLLYLLLLITISIWGTVPTLVLFLGHYQEPATNFIPFSSILTYIMNFEHYNFSIWFYNLFGNILAYIPLGYFIALLFPTFNQARQILLISLFPITALEIIQYISVMGVFDVDDVLLNMLGAWIGFLLYNSLAKIFKDK
ncbi:glycopeptide antibiotics resistance protein [Evansella vedderi]|uniref:Glycopeptide antibiotics resistance protein n=1 Tax=Evansella vedderi TaxID=38282 RepID=A0ABU0A3L4_9BACI|nr:glycopeptide antibiotics resistance protein [Evansella vedderi]